MDFNYKIVCDLVDKNSNILDLGCSDGALLELLKKKKNVKGLGIEINQDAVIEALSKGLSVVQGDLDKGLNEFQDKSYDYAILNPEFVIFEMLRVAKKSIITFPNFAYWRVRFYLFFKGKMPKSKMLPYEWHDTPNVHLLTINDFFEFCAQRNIKIEKAIYFTRKKARGGFFMRHIANFLSQEALFVISR